MTKLIANQMLSRFAQGSLFNAHEASKKGKFLGRLQIEPTNPKKFFRLVHPGTEVNLRHSSKKYFTGNVEVPKEEFNSGIEALLAVARSFSDSTLIKSTKTVVLRNVASTRKTVPVEGKLTRRNGRFKIPADLRRLGEDDTSRVSGQTLARRKLVKVPPLLRRKGETAETMITRGALIQRKPVIVPADLRRIGEGDGTIISYNTLAARRRRRHVALINP